MIIFKAKFSGFIKQLTGLKFSFTTKDEFDPIILEQMKGMHGWIAFSEDVFKANVENAMSNRKVRISTEGKSDSQLLRGTLYQVWCRSDYKMIWDDWYHQEMSRINKHYEDKYLK